MELIYHPDLAPDLPIYGIEVPIADNRSHLIYENLKGLNSKLSEFDLNSLELIGRDDLLCVHDEDFINALYDPIRAKGELIKAYELIDEAGNLYRYNPEEAEKTLSEMVPSLFLQASGSLTAMKLAVDKGSCFFLGGGMHHAMSFGGRGFCPINDIVIGARRLQNEGLAQKIWVIDVDAHKGDGTAELTQNDESIATLSIHMAKGWPVDGPRENASGDLLPWFIPSTVDIGVEKGKDDQYLSLLKNGLHELREKSFIPDFVIVVDGADPYEKDELLSAKRLSLSLEQLLERDRMVYNFVKAQNAPSTWLMAGGYGSHSHEVYTQFLRQFIRH